MSEVTEHQCPNCLETWLARDPDPRDPVCPSCRNPENKLTFPQAPRERALPKVNWINCPECGDAWKISAWDDPARRLALKGRWRNACERCLLRSLEAGDSKH